MIMEFWRWFHDILHNHEFICEFILWILLRFHDHEFIWPMNSYMNSCIWRISWKRTWIQGYQGFRWYQVQLCCRRRIHCIRWKSCRPCLSLLAPTTFFASLIPGNLAKCRDDSTCRMTPCPQVIVKFPTFLKPNVYVAWGSEAIRERRVLNGMSRMGDTRRRSEVSCLRQTRTPPSW